MNVDETDLEVNGQLRFVLFGLECALNVEFNPAEVERLFDAAELDEGAGGEYIFWQGSGLSATGRVDDYESGFVLLRVESRRPLAPSVSEIGERAKYQVYRAMRRENQMSEINNSEKPARAKTPRKAATGAGGDATDVFTDDERAAMREMVRERKAAASASKADGESDVLAKIAEMPESDRAMAERLHAIVKSVAPGLAPKTWYGMPAYARDGQVVCFFQSAQKFKARYATLGFSDKANLDDGPLWPTSFALKELNDAEEAQIRALLTKAVG